MTQHIIDLSTLSPTQGFIIQVDAPGDRAGGKVSSAGDVNGDGFAEVIVGAFEGDDGGFNAGEAYVLFGGTDEFGDAVGGRQVIDVTTLAAAQGFIIQGEAAGDHAGYSVSAAGDVDGDGFDDVIVGAPRGDDGGSYAGAAYVLFGGAGGFGDAVGGRQVVDLTTLTAAQGFVIQGDAAGDWAGVSVSDAGDVNDDGFDDVIVGAPDGDDGGRNAGEAYVLFGGANGFGTTIDGRQVVDLTTLTAAQGFVIRGDVGFDQTGSSVSAAGDVNGDGFADVIVGAPEHDHFTGDAYVVFGGSGGFGTVVGTRRVVDLSALRADRGFVIRGAAYDNLGLSVSSAGDVNGDGFADVIVGAHVNGDGGWRAGAAYVLFGGAGGFGTAIGGRQVVDLTTLAAAQGFIIQGDAADDVAGLSVSSAGDVNGDGFGDVIVGAAGRDDGGDSAGAAYVLFGGASGFGEAVGGRQVVDLTTLTAAQGFVVQGGARGDYAGRSVSAAGDVDGDGFADLIVGAPGIYGRPLPAKAYVVFGGNFTGAVYRTGTSDDDVVRTGPTSRIIFGAQGEDTVLGNQGADSLNGGSGDDSLNGDRANDTLAGGSGDDRAVGGFGDDRALGGDGNDTLSGRDGNDRLEGEANEDRLSGDAGDDSLDGGQGRDTLFGGAGNDTLLGSGRGDVLVGGEGVDFLTGGSGFDRFVFAAGSSSVETPDTVTDFVGGIDKLLLSTGHGSGSFLGAAAFTGGGGIEVRYDAGSHLLQVDVNGDGLLGAGDLAIAGTTLATLTADDLLFV